MSTPITPASGSLAQLLAFLAASLIGLGAVIAGAGIGAAWPALPVATVGDETERAMRTAPTPSTNSEEVSYVTPRPVVTKRIKWIGPAVMRAPAVPVAQPSEWDLFLTATALAARQYQNSPSAPLGQGEFHCPPSQAHPCH